MPNYRAFVIAMLPKLRVLDFQKVRAAEREAAEAMHGATSAAAAAASSSSAGAKRPRTFEPGEAADDDADAASSSKAPKAGPTPEQVAKIKAAIANASSLEEVARLEKALKSGNYEVVAAAADGAAGGGEGGAPNEG